MTPTPIHPWLTEARRASIYRVAFAAMPLLIAGGLLTEQDGPLWLGLIGALLSTGTAAAHTPR